MARRQSSTRPPCSTMHPTTCATPALCGSGVHNQPVQEHHLANLGLPLLADSSRFFSCQTRSVCVLFVSARASAHAHTHTHPAPHRYTARHVHASQSNVHVQNCQRVRLMPSPGKGVGEHHLGVVELHSAAGLAHVAPTVIPLQDCQLDRAPARPAELGLLLGLRGQLCLLRLC